MSHHVQEMTLQKDFMSEDTKSVLGESILLVGRENVCRKLVLTQHQCPVPPKQTTKPQVTESTKQEATEGRQDKGDLRCGKAGNQPAVAHRDWTQLVSQRGRHSEKPSIHFHFKALKGLIDSFYLIQSL